MKNNTSTETKLSFPTFSKFFHSLFPTFRKLFHWLFSWPIIRRVLITSAVVVTLVVSFYTVELVRGKWAWNNYGAEVEARGESLDIAALIPPPVPDEENFAMIPLFRDTLHFKRPLDASKQLDLGPHFKSLKSVEKPEAKSRLSWQKGERTDLSDWQRYYRSEGNPESEEKIPTALNPQSPAEDVLLALTLRKDGLDKLQEGSLRRHSRFPIDYEANFAALLPHLYLLKQASLTLRYRALAHLAAGNSELAFQDTILGVYLRDTIKSEPFLISHLVRYSINSIMIQPVWEGIADGKWNENQLKVFQEVFEGYNWLADFKQTMRGERAFSILTLDMIADSSETYAHFLGYETLAQYKESPLSHFLFPRGWIYQNKLNICRWEDRSLSDIVNEKNMTLDMEQVTSLDIENGNLKSSPYHFFARMMVPALSQATLQLAQAQTVSDRAAIACAIERYRLATGSLPKTLDQLVPIYIETLPHDVINGEPLIYRQEGNRRYLLYSVGSDQSDDGGDFEKDWVWLYEAAPDLNAANASN